MVARVIASPAALALIASLQSRYGSQLFFFQSGGCCDNSAPHCYLEGELTLSAADVRLGAIGGVPFYMRATQFERWKHTQLIIDAIDTLGASDSLSLEGSDGKAFITRSRVFSPEELATLAAAEQQSTAH